METLGIPSPNLTLISQLIPDHSCGAFVYFGKTSLKILSRIKEEDLDCNRLQRARIAMEKRL